MIFVEKEERFSIKLKKKGDHVYIWGVEKDNSMYSSEQLIKMVKIGEGTPEYFQALTFIYNTYKNDFYARLTRGKYQLSNEVALDIYHQGISILVQKIQKDKLSNQNIPAYLWGICNNLFLQYQDKNIRDQKNKENYKKYNNLSSVDNEAEDKLLSQAYRQLVDQIFQQIGEKCQKILLWRQMSFSYQEIAQKLNPESPSSSDVMRVLAGRCTKKLIQLVQDKPALKKQIDDLLN